MESKEERHNVIISNGIVFIFLFLGVSLILLVVIFSVSLFRISSFDRNTVMSNNANRISEKNDIRSNTLLSNFGVNEYYVCSGTCYCHDEDSRSRRSSASNVVSKSLVYFVSAITLSFALKHAEEHFYNECHQSAFPECPLDLIHVEMSECEKTESESSSVVSHKDNNLNKKEKIVFTCRGNCRRRIFVDEYTSKLQLLKEVVENKRFGGESLEEERIFQSLYFLDENLKIKQFCESKRLVTDISIQSYGSADEALSSDAEKLFLMGHFSPFCKRVKYYGFDEGEIIEGSNGEKSVESVLGEDVTDMNIMKALSFSDGQKDYISICTANVDLEDDEKYSSTDFKAPNDVVCVRLDEE